MSNVLIGIIGVILFIGLALAGALFLGPRFQESTNTSKAAASVQSVAQAAHAANLYRVQEGMAVTAATTVSSLVGTYLKSVPNNPANGTAIGFSNEAGAVDASSATVAWMTAHSVDAKSVCTAIARQSGQPETDVSSGLATIPSRTTGCFQVARSGTGPLGQWPEGTLLIFARI